ncbi:MAG TPA: bifunctional methylenetetrahydrofolate dehydrogenase/methenyltetrahydrofolate cyclohydrolase FolD [Candidatus Faecaligallichristensenella faecipullorum]|nr:bifunctional methylenetetrahydrofolate dehydrogenase/methenyltetrahydrofolate cyclohydrolase FolD [Candidatus Faecaligallichristensenella faecipullorum]
MSAIRIDGKQISQQIRSEIAERVAVLKQKGVTPGLAVILVGEDPASQVYVRNKERACIQAGMASRVIRLPEDTPQESLMALIDEINRDEKMHGLLVQLPLPAHLDEAQVLKAIDPKKDVDGFHAINAGALMNGEKAPVACTPQGCIELLKRSGVELCGANAVVVGRSNIVGKPMAMLLLRENCTVTICHSKTRNLKEFTQKADVLVAAIGRPKFITADMVKPGAAVIDVGINRLADGKLCGDVDYEQVEPIAGWITPVPGGVGPMTIAMLLKNTLEAAERHGR